MKVKRYNSRVSSRFTPPQKKKEKKKKLLIVVASVKNGRITTHDITTFCRYITHTHTQRYIVEKLFIKTSCLPIFPYILITYSVILYPLGYYI